MRATINKSRLSGRMNLKRWRVYEIKGIAIPIKATIQDKLNSCHEGRHALKNTSCVRKEKISTSSVNKLSKNQYVRTFSGLSLKIKKIIRSKIILIRPNSKQETSNFLKS